MRKTVTTYRVEIHDIKNWSLGENERINVI